MVIPSKMIRVMKSFRRDDMLFTISTYINSKMAGIKTDGEKTVIERDLKNRIMAIEKDGFNEFNILELKNYLTDKLFKHFIDVKAIDNYVDNVVGLIVQATKSIDHKGLVLLFYY